MAKRTRTGRSVRRPGGQGPNRTKKASGAEESSGIPVEPAVIAAEDIGASYSDVEVDEVAAAAVAGMTATPATPATPEPATPGRRSRGRAARTSKRRSHDDLASRAAAETVWVREDLRRIGVVSVVVLAALAVAYVVFGFLDVLNLY